MGLPEATDSVGHTGASHGILDWAGLSYNDSLSSHFEWIVNQTSEVDRANFQAR